MVFSPAHIKRCALTWEAPDYSASYPAGYTDQGVAVIAVAQEHRQAQGFCYSALSTVVFISKQDGTRAVINEEPLLFQHTHSLMESCDEVHPRLLGRAVLAAWDHIPEQYRCNLVTIAADRKHLKHLFRDCDHLKTIMEYRAFEKVLDPYDNHSLGEVHVKLAGTPAYERMQAEVTRTRETVDAMVHDALAPRPLEQLEDYSVFTDCSFRSTHNKKYQRGGRMGIAGVSEDGFYFHSHYDGVNIMTGELSAVLAAYTVFHSGSRRLIINTDSLGAITFVLRLAHSRWTFETWASEGVQDERVVAQMRSLTEAIREKRVLVKHVPGHTGHGLQESSDSVSKMHRHFPGQIVDKRHQSEFNQRCESIITALAGCAKAVRLMAPDWVQIKPSSIHAGNRLWR
ncbi:MAG: RNase H family protein [Rothia mucilaginosa]|uniref:Ribonuclease HI n=1 Tax=Rothia mucilaginosa TaxID=43675 RepID=A0A930LUH3_9MICC|nr:RNase H family protein [uncultured Rothia sp.]MBF1673572.1 ribonuclease HI [Rothia mucilaginosa]MBF1676526.1 ribonuclease HI [Rothia sp. (in: high G+C Gram-positive bacteria)]MDU6366729.1 RNase H family protein [Rothia mucilaginosa]OFQ28855.1 ribonuclease HI [Rothia sp. HMSC072E10]